MALPAKGPYVQDLPPSEGYPAINFRRRTPSRGPPGWAMWLGASAIIGYGFYKVAKGNNRRNAMKREKREARMCITPFLQAEWDAHYVIRKQEELKMEEEIMGHVPGWKVGESTMKSGIWVPPRRPLVRL